MKIKYTTFYQRKFHQKHFTSQLNSTNFSDAFKINQKRMKVFPTKTMTNKRNDEKVSTLKNDLLVCVKFMTVVLKSF